MSGHQPSRFMGFSPARINLPTSANNPPRDYNGGSETDVSTSNENLSREERYVIRHTERQEPQGQEHLPSNTGICTPSNRSSLDVSTCSYNTLIIHNADDLEGSKRTSHHFDRSITDIPDDYLSQSQVLKHLAKEVITSTGISKDGDHAPSSLLRSKALRRDKMHLSRSHPDLRHIGLVRSKGRHSKHESNDYWPEIVDSLNHENARLKLELESYVQKLSKTHKLEQEFTKVARAQEELVASSERQGRLEREARARLQVDCRRLQELNRALRDQVEMLSAQLLTSRGVSSASSSVSSASTSSVGDASFRRELCQRDVVIAQLITSNKELAAAKERQEIELAAQRATLQEQRTHIDILDTALTNAQGNVVRLEEECRKKQMYVEQLKTALTNQQQASERREQTEHKLRLQLERELRAERSKSSASDHSNPGYSSGGNSSCLSSHPINDSTPELKRKLRERDEKIMKLEGEVAKWEQRYLEESALRQAAIAAASLPKDAKIAALEKTTQETEKIIAEARSEKIRYMDEVHAAQKKVADLESRLKELESKLAEKDAMIKVLQKHTFDKDVASTSYPSITYSDLSRQDIGPSTSVFSTVSSVLTSSTGFTSFSGCSDSSGKLYHQSPFHTATNVSDAGPKLSYHGDSTSKLSFSSESGPLIFGGETSSKIGSYGSFRGQYSGGQSFDDTKKTLDDQLKELDSQLDSQLLSKRGLCCFPGFSNTGTAPRKGKISQPLLAGVVGGLSAGNRARPEEMLLLEKQGRSSQRQRAGSLPPSALPSSLPRPSRRSRKLGEYGRLSDSESAARNTDVSFFDRKTPEDTSSNNSLRFGRRDGSSDRSRKISTDETLARPPPTPTKLEFGYVRLKTPPRDHQGCSEYRRHLSSDGASSHTEFVNFPRLKTPESGSFMRKQVGEENHPTSPAFVSYSRLKTSPPSPPQTNDEVDIARKTPPKKSFIPPPRRLGEYGRLGSARSSSDSAAAARDSQDSGTSGTPPRRGSSVVKELPANCRIRF